MISLFDFLPNSINYLKGRWLLWGIGLRSGGVSVEAPVRTKKMCLLVPGEVPGHRNLKQDPARSSSICGFDPVRVIAGKKREICRWYITDFNLKQKHSNKIRLKKKNHCCPSASTFPADSSALLMFPD